jgi:dTDP-4-amino-4,6-dideoxygalactose transaminase
MKKHQFILENRASLILYHFLVSNNTKFKNKTFLLPANICPIVACTFFKANQKIELIDISPKTLCISEKIIKKKLSENVEKYAGLLFNYTYGNTLCFNHFFAFLKKNYPNFILIEDRCLCRPAIFFTENQKETHSDLILFSTGKRKFLEIEEEGGFAFLHKKYEYRTDFFREKYKVADAIFLEKKWKKENANVEILSQKLQWLNMNEFFVSEKKYCKKVAEKLPFCEAHKEKINVIYRSFLPKENTLEDAFQQWRFQIFVPKKEVLLQKIFENNLFASSHYASLASILGLKKSFPIASKLHSKVINLFNDFYFSEKQAVEISKIIVAHLEQNKAENI